MLGNNDARLSVVLDDVSFTYGKYDNAVLKNIKLKIADGEAVAIVGASGTGKSTLLKLIAGLLPATKGKITGTENVSVGLAPQAPTLLPWLDITGNVTFKKRLGKKTKIDKQEALSLLDRFGIGDKASSKPNELSGGQQSRAALARALAGQPQLLLLDEPFSTLDEITAEAIMLDLQKILKDTKPTTVFVSHNIAQAAFLADKIIVLGGTPATVIGIVSVKNHATAVSEARKLLKESVK